MERTEGDKIISESCFACHYENDLAGYRYNYQLLMTAVEKIEVMGLWVTIYTNMVSVGKFGELKALWAIHHNGTRDKKEMIWLAIIRVIQEKVYE